MSEKLTSEIDKKIRREEQEKSQGWASRALDLRMMKLRANNGGNENREDQGNETVRAGERERQEETPAQSELRVWFVQNAADMLKHYVDKLIDEGFDTLDSFANIREIDLDRMEIKMGHVQQLVRLALKAKERTALELPSSSSSPSSSTVGGVEDYERRLRNLYHMDSVRCRVEGVDQIPEEEIKKGIKKRKESEEVLRRRFLDYAPKVLEPYAPKLLDSERIKSETFSTYCVVVLLSKACDKEKLKPLFVSRIASAFHAWFAENTPKEQKPFVEGPVDDWIGAVYESLCRRLD